MRRYGLYIFLVLISIFCVGNIKAQDSPEPDFTSVLSNIRILTLPNVNGTIKLDSLDIVPESFIITTAKSQEAISDSCWRLDPILSQLSLNCPNDDSIRVIFRVFPFDIDAKMSSNKGVVVYEDDSIYYNPFYYNVKEVSQAEFLNFGDLDYSGSFSRGISLGSNQDFVLNSSLDLQLSGKIGNDIEIVAALTDNNIPIQPDGNTQQIQDFDKIFIQVKKDEHELTVGDYQLNRNDRYFMKLNRQLQGASYKGQFDFEESGVLGSSASFAIAKGQFVRNSFIGQENNQGPYRLSGQNGASFIIILAGSEKVFVDGKRLVRGQEQDYIIDYNSGELTFTPNYLITKDARITVEFEYADQNYLRTMIHSGHEYQYKKLKTFVSVYSQQDAKNQSIQQELSEEQKNYLQSAGNDADDLFFPGVSEVEFDATKILYKQIDTTVNSVFYDSVFVFSSNVDSAKYELRFAFLGSGKGNYSPSVNAANQRVYKWVAPKNGLLQGSYEPVIQLVAPQSQQMLTAGLELKLNDKMSLTSSIALTNKDENTFSDVGNKDNKGIASQVSLLRTDVFGKKKNKYTMYNELSYEFKGKTFEQIEPYRNVEFARDWSDDLNINPAQEHLMSASWNVNHQNLKSSYTFSTFQKPSIYKGYRNIASLWYKKNGWTFKSKIDYVTTNQMSLKTSFFSPEVEVLRFLDKKKIWQLGVGGWQEVNKRKENASNDLIATSLKSNNLEFFLKSMDTSKVQLLFNYKYRTDARPDGEDFLKSNSGSTFLFKGAMKYWKQHNLDWTITYRQLAVIDTTIDNLQSEQTVLGRLDYATFTKKNWLRFNVSYQLGSGQERIREYAFLEVPSGQGVFKWIDENDDNIQQVNEFVLAEFADSAQFVRVLVNSNDFVRANEVTYNQVLNINPRSVWFNETGIKKLLSRFSLLSSIQSTRKSTQGENVNPFNPFLFGLSNNNVLSSNSILRNVVFFNQADPVFSMNYTWQYNQNKILLINGIDSRNKLDHIINIRWNVSKAISLELDQTNSKNIFDAQIFDNNDYNLKEYKTDFTASYINTSKFRVSVSYVFNKKDNAENAGGEQALFNSLKNEFKYNIAGKSSVVTNFAFTAIKFDGSNGTTKSYTILEGLQNGKNYLWGVQFDRRLANSIQLGIQYEGRKTGNAKVVNTGRATLRANF